LNQTLAVAYRNQIRNGDTRLFAQTGKPRTGAVGEGGKISERLAQKLNRTRPWLPYQFRRFAKGLAGIAQAL
jgi:hypothetical protein